MRYTHTIKPYRVKSRENLVIIIQLYPTCLCSMPVIPAHVPLGSRCPQIWSGGSVITYLKHGTEREPTKKQKQQQQQKHFSSRERQTILQRHQQLCDHQTDSRFCGDKIIVPLEQSRHGAMLAQETVPAASLLQVLKLRKTRSRFTA